MSLRERIVDVLMRQGLLTAAQGRALSQPPVGVPRALSTQLIALGLDSVTVLKAVCAETGWPLAPNARLRDAAPQAVPAEVDWRAALAAPFAEEGGELLIAFADPDLAQDLVETLPPHRPHVAVEPEVRRLLDRLGVAAVAPASAATVAELASATGGEGGAPVEDGFDLELDFDELETRPRLEARAAVARPGGPAGNMAEVWQQASASMPPDFFTNDETESFDDRGRALDTVVPADDSAGASAASALPWEVEPAPSLNDGAPLGEDDPLDRFERLGDVLGRGGMAKVERARDKDSGREVALKILHPHLVENEEEVARFAREVRFLEQLKHGNIVRVLARGLNPPEVFVACELVDGYTAKDLIQRCAPVPPVAAARLMLEVLQALAHAHEHGIVHRDLKPENLLISRTGSVKLCDFGVASPPGEKPPAGLVGTPAYMSPEQTRGKPTDERSDLFSAGTVFFELLTGQNPFQADEPHLTMHRICEVGAPLLFELDPTVPGAVDRVIERLLPLDPEARFPSAAEPAAMLEAFLKPVASLYDDLLVRCFEEPEVTQVLLRSDQSEAELARGKAIPRGSKSKACQAALAFFRAKELDPANEEAESLLQALCDKEGLRFSPSGDQRIRSLRMALSDDPDNPDLLLRVSDLCRKDGDLVQAVVHLKRLLRCQPRDKRARTQLTYLCGDDAQSPFGLGVDAA